LIECKKTQDEVSTVQRLITRSRAVHPRRAVGTCDDVELLREFHIITPAPGQMAPIAFKDPYPVKLNLRPEAEDNCTLLALPYVVVILHEHHRN
jgi:hypothetical protein